MAGSAGVRDLDPGAFAFVMATGIMSTALHHEQAPVASAVLLLIGLAGYAGLFAAYGWRLVRWRQRFFQDVVSPHGFAFLTFVAASNVLANRLAAAGLHWPALALWAVGTIGWVVLGYGIPLGLIANARRRSGLDQFDGTWFIWAVGTQSVSVAATSLAAFGPTTFLVDLASVFWAVGLLQYLLMAPLGLARLLLRPVSPTDLVPAYWVFMGAGAITVLAGAELLALPDTQDLLVPRSVLTGTVMVLWAFCTWLIPLLLALGLWRYVLRRVPLGYETRLWSMVFPLGMYGVASYQLGRANNTPWLADVGRVETWIAAAVWILTFLAMLASARRTRGTSAFSTRSSHR